MMDASRNAHHTLRRGTPDRHAQEVHVKYGEYLSKLTWRGLALVRRQQTGNAYNLRELAGAFGELGTLIPFLVGYITVSKMDPVGVLVSFGLFKIFAGLYFKTPVPIQPMKAIGTAAISHAGSL